MGAFIDNEIPLLGTARDDGPRAGGATAPEPVSTLGTPMRLFSKHALPYSHSAAYTACPRTRLVAGCDLRTHVLERWGEIYGVSERHLYTDYKQMIAQERPDIVSVATQPEHRAEIIIYAIEHGARAIYAEKALAASVEQGDAIAAACAKHSVALNMGTNRRYDTGYDAACELIHSGEIGALKSIVVHSTSALFNGLSLRAAEHTALQPCCVYHKIDTETRSVVAGASHTLDIANRLAGDVPVVSVQGDLTNGHAMVAQADGSERPMVDGRVLRGDPTGQGTIRYANGVTAYMLNSGAGTEVEAICERGIIRGLNNGESWVRGPLN
jgi:predicted dehydrogenase|eukprot:COSAG01_NODE_5585_length_4163_cov_1.897146_9_plen_326_part_00